MKAWELLDSLEKWCKGALSKDAWGFPVSIEEGVCWCTAGAILKCHPEDNAPLRNKTLFMLESVLKDRKMITMGQSTGAWNDAPKRTWREVYDLLRELDI